MMKELAGTTIVITGASSGIGAATAVACGAAGMNVVLGGRRLDRLEQVSRRVEAVGGSEAQGLRGGKVQRPRSSETQRLRSRGTGNNTE